MKIQELKDLLRHYPETELRALIVELYKSIPTAVKEDRAIDGLIKEFQTVRRKDATITELPLLIQEIKDFLTHAYHGRYLKENRLIPKHEQKKWRFKLKQYLRLLNALKEDGEENQLAAEWLSALYTLLQTACIRPLFPGGDPFRQLNVDQLDLLKQIIYRRFLSGVNTSALTACILLCNQNGYASNILAADLQEALLDNLKTAQARELALEIAARLRQEGMNDYQVLNERAKHEQLSHRITLEAREKVNRLTILILKLNLCLFQYEEGIDDFIQAYADTSKEVMYYVLLELLYRYELVEEWLRVYEKAVRQGVQFKNNLQAYYVTVKENGVFAEHYL